VAGFVIVTALLAAATLYINLANPFGLRIDESRRQADIGGPGASQQAGAPVTEALVVVTANGRFTFLVELADTPGEQSRGLMFRESMPADHGMLFAYPVEREVTMWMKNTFLSLDMAFIRADGRVHRIVERTEPLSETTVPSRGPVRAVLELNAGAAARIGLKPGDRIEHPFFEGG
jgi:hypothetical protein